MQLLEKDLIPQPPPLRVYPYFMHFGTHQKQNRQVFEVFFSFLSTVASRQGCLHQLKEVDWCSRLLCT
ncbi:hypothetical protein E2562_026185 [Oryza meyeriana var. granulata]|uniref:Uncharacterized protein n=1 Tax=Oryza meyeriana var. granulata TaxID=110450 RepID=A0A6G1E2U2_9ORYZ|nr:hypothetical protein E2562_026185 [Oryza meyeriana var. granulata]